MPRQLSDPLTEDDKIWLRSYNRQGEIPGEEDGTGYVPVPGNPPEGGSPTGFTPAAGPPDESGTGDGDGDEDPFNGEDPPEDYNDWTNAQLQYELGQRSLPKSGNKDALVARLVEDDENDETPQS
jgi:hypothetical protein